MPVLVNRRLGQAWAIYRLPCPTVARPNTILVCRSHLGIALLAFLQRFQVTLWDQNAGRLVVASDLYPLTIRGLIDDGRKALSRCRCRYPLTHDVVQVLAWIRFRQDVVVDSFAFGRSSVLAH